MKEISYVDRIKALRKSKGLTQAEFANLMDVSQSAVGNWESGARIPDIYAFAKMSQIFGVSIDCIVGLDENTLSIPVTGRALPEPVSAIIDLKTADSDFYAMLRKTIADAIRDASAQ